MMMPRSCVVGWIPELELFWRIIQTASPCWDAVASANVEGARDVVSRGTNWVRTTVLSYCYRPGSFGYLTRGRGSSSKS